MHENTIEMLDVPVLFLIFNRPNITAEVLNAIRKVKPTRLYVAADGPRLNKSGEQELCEKTREVLQLIDWDCKLKTLFRENNLGCKVAVSDAISWFFENEEMGIILEDDCLPHKSFFPFCAELLYKYKLDERIMLIGGHNFLANDNKISESYYFSQYPNIWGWASWRRAWSLYDRELIGLDNFYNNKLSLCFLSSSQRSDIKKHLNLVRENKLNTWDFQWQYSILNADSFAITPKKNMLINLGFRNHSTHEFLIDSRKEIAIQELTPFPLNHPEIVEVNYNADYITFKNVKSKGPARMIRLIKENGIIGIIKYLIRRL